VRIAVAGCGYWGINHVRVFNDLADLRLICDPSEKAARRAKKIAPGAEIVADVEALASADIDGVVLATPAVDHARHAIAMLEAGKHVLVEKPLALSAADAERVAEAAKAAGKTVAVGHLMLYHPVTQRLRKMLDSGELGELFYLHSTRVNLGRLRRDENTLWSFAPHDLSMIDFLVDAKPVSVATRGQSYLQEGIEDVCFVTLKFDGGQMAHIHLSWLNPRKERRLTLVCSKKMVEFDDVSSEKLRIFDKGYDRPPTFTHFDEYLTLRHGDVHIPHVPMTEPLAAEARDFLTAISKGTEVRSDLGSGLRTVKILEAAQRSLDADGAPMPLS
jgi:predicted dehydrogenase